MVKLSMNNFGLDHMFKTMKPELVKIAEKYINQENVDTDSMINEIISKIKSGM